MNNIYLVQKNRSDIGCFYIGSKKSDKKKEGKKWLNKEVPLHFFLMFLILFCGVILSIPHRSFLNKNVRLWSASLVSVFDAEFEERPDFNKDIEPQFFKLPLTNNIVYAFPLSPEKERPKPPETPPPVKKKLVKVAASINPEAKFSKEEFKNGKYIKVDISDQAMTIYGDGELKGIYKVSTGKPGYRTPTGDFKVLRESANVWSKACQCWMPYALEFKSGLFIHELPLWPGGAREGENHLGIPVSHGCIRLGIGPAKEVFDFADIGTPVIIHQ